MVVGGGGGFYRVLSPKEAQAEQCKEINLHLGEGSKEKLIIFT